MLMIEKKLKIIINSFVSASKENPSVSYVNESILHNIVIQTGKVYHTKKVDSENSKGFFSSYRHSLRPHQMSSLKFVRNLNTLIL